MRRILSLAAAASLAVSGLARAQVNQPAMQAALQDLYAARQEILRADQYHDHGGYAGDATRRIDQAINDVNAGIAYRDSHGP